MRGLRSLSVASLVSTSLVTFFYINQSVAGPADYVFTPIVEAGEKEVDFKYGTAKAPDGTRKTVYSLGFGYGATDYWFTELYLKRELQGGDSLSLLEWENKFQLTETGKYPIDVGLITEIEAPLNNGKAPCELKFGPLFQTEFGKLQLNANVLFETKIGGADEERHFTELGYQWQAKYRLKPAFEFGLQGIGEVGEWKHWDNADEQAHRSVIVQGVMSCEIHR